MTTDVRAAYRRCEEITWSQARNFSYGIRLLPPAKRQALAAVYAFARRDRRHRRRHPARPGKAHPAGGGQGRAVRAPGRRHRRRRRRARRAGRRSGTVRHPAARVRRTDRRLRRRRARGQLRDLRRPAALLPVRGRVDRAAVPRRVRHQRPASRRYRWPTRSASRSSSPTSCGTSARTTPPAGSTCPPRTSRGSAAALRRRPIPAADPGQGQARPRWWSSRRTAPAPGTPRASR